jgi:hypothetical protein
MEDKLDDILKGLKQWTESEKKEYMSSLGSDDGAGGESGEAVGDHPLFMTNQPTLADLKRNPALSAISNAAYDEFETPLTLCKEAKEYGNEAFKRGPSYYGQAIRHYNEALTHVQALYTSVGIDTTTGLYIPAKKRDSDLVAEGRGLEGSIWGNLSAVYLSRKRYITALECAEKCLKISANNTKVLYRAAKCCLETGRGLAAKGFCSLALSLDPGNSALLDLQKAVQKLLDTQDSIRRATQSEITRRTKQIEDVRAAVKERGMQIGPLMYRNMRRTMSYPYLDEHDVLHWPVLLLYPQYHQSDWVDDVSEVRLIPPLPSPPLTYLHVCVQLQVAPLSDILSHVLPDEGPCPSWDVRGEYVARNVDIFYMSNPCKQVDVTTAWQEYIDSAQGGKGEGEEKEEELEIDWGHSTRMMRIAPAAPLLLPLVQRTYITGDIPVFYVIARSSETYREVMSTAGEVLVPDLPPPPPTHTGE